MFFLQPSLVIVSAWIAVLEIHAWKNRNSSTMNQDSLQAGDYPVDLF
jgi:hypothetical protein